jgi:hypothetical protein
MNNSDCCFDNLFRPKTPVYRYGKPPKDLDLSLTVRFASLSNNAKLSLVNNLFFAMFLEFQLFTLNSHLFVCFRIEM